MIAATERPKAKSSQSVDLVEILERDVYPRLSAEQIYSWSGHDFKRSGNRLRGNPPWGQSKSGTSFTAFDDLGFLDSHNGNESGDPIKYLYSLKLGHYEYPRGKDWIEIVKELFNLAGVPFPEREWTPEQIKQAQRRESRQNILQAVQDYCADILWTARGEAERKHLIEERGFTEEGLKDFAIGLYPSIKEIKEVLSKRGLDAQLAKDIGVLSPTWEGYMLFPWATPYGQPLTLYGHQTKAWAEATGNPKKIALFNPKDNGQAWLHTKESPFLFNRAVRDRHKELVLVEGITDAAIAQQFGDTRVVACVAAMFSKDQCETLKRHRIERVIIALDPDAAGDAGIESCIKSLAKVGISAYVAPKLPDGLDPDEFILKYGIDTWKAHIAGAEHGFRWKAKTIIAAGNVTTDAGKEAVLKTAKDFHQANIKTHSAELKTFFWPEIKQALGTLDLDDSGHGGNGNGNDDGDDWGDYGGDGDGGGEHHPPNQWVAPTSWKGELGWLIKEEDEDGSPISKFYPKCNFDFQIEAELSSDQGGGLVLQVKRSLDSRQRRVIVSSQDYGSAKDFEAALKRVYKAGVVCNLKSEHLKALIHVKLREYRDRNGITYRLQERAGQQSDGHWVFENCQLTSDGEWSASPNSDWIFNEDLGGEDKMPQPSVAPPNPDALKRLVAAMRKFHGAEGIFPAMMALGFSAAAVHYGDIIKQERRFPQLNLIGDAGSNKSICAANGLSLVGWLNGDGQISGVSESKLYECLKLTGSLPLCLDDPQKSRELDEVLKRLYNGVPRLVRGNYQKPHSPLMVTSNHAIGDQQLATLTRMLQVPVYRQTDGDSRAWDEMQGAMEGASGCLPDLIKLGYPKDQVKELEQELRQHLPKSHPRIASSMALVTWYAIAVAKLADFDADSIKQYVIGHLCPIANAADTNSDSITDFLDKLSALKSDALVGDWNCLRVETKTGKALAVQMSQVFPLVDKYFNPVYSRKVLETLIAKAGGNLQSVQKFHVNRDESLAYYRARITADVEPKEPEFKPKRCVLIPLQLIKGFVDDWEPPTPSDTSDTPTTHKDSDSPQSNTIHEPVTSLVTPVTSNNSQLHKKCNQQDVYPVSVSATLDTPVTSFLEKTIDLNQENQEAISNQVGQFENSHTLIPEKNVTETYFEPETLTVTESERLHFSCNQHVTGCNQQEKDVTESESAAPGAASAVDTFTLGEKVIVNGLPGVIGKIGQIDLEYPQAPYRVDSAIGSSWFAATDIEKLSFTHQQASQKPREAKEGDHIHYGEFTGTLAAKGASGWHVNWSLCPSLLKHFPALPAVVRDGEFKLL